MTRSALLLLPGLLCDETVWLSQIAALRDRYECVVPSYDHAESIPAMAEHVLDHAPDSFALAGHSMGGRVALEVMRLAPARVTRLALLDTGYKALADGAPGEQEVAGRLQLVRMAEELGMRAMGQVWLKGMVHSERMNDTALCNAILKMIDSKTPAIFRRQIQALIARPDATEVLRRIHCPTTFICGREDQWSPLSRHEEMSAQVEGSRVVPIADAGHMSTMEQPEAVSAALLSWLTTGQPGK